MGRLRDRRSFVTLIANQGVSDTTAPTVASFTATTPVIGTTVTITAFTASEVGVSFLITESSTPPLPDDIGWVASAPTEFVASGSATLYPWVKDAAGNVSSVYGSPVAVVVYQTPAYANAGGTGNRTVSITVTTTLGLSGAASNWVNGVTTTDTSVYVSPNGQAVSGKVIKFNFTTARIINEAKWYQGSIAAEGTWKWQASNDDSAWVDIGSPFDLGTATTQTITELSANVTPYIYYRLLGTAGNVSDSPYLQEMEFKIANPT
jgi:hypothetical protein